jgi:hypothetical protein
MNQRTPVFRLAALALTACTPEPEVTEPDVAPATEETRSQPNLLLLVANDMGYTDLGAYGSEPPPAAGTASAS